MLSAVSIMVPDGSCGTIRSVYRDIAGNQVDVCRPSSEAAGSDNEGHDDKASNMDRFKKRLKIQSIEHQAIPPGIFCRI